MLSVLGLIKPEVATTVAAVVTSVILTFTVVAVLQKPTGAMKTAAILFVPGVAEPLVLPPREIT